MQQRPLAKPVKRPSWHRLKYAYHEAGHAVVGHWVGRCIASLSIIPDRSLDLFDAPILGYCLFDQFAEAEHEVRGWQPGERNPAQLAILYAGVSAYVNACDEHHWKVTHWRSVHKQDLEAIEHILDQLGLAPAERIALQQEQQQLALDLVLEFWPAIEDVAQVLAERGTLAGHKVHQLIYNSLRQTTSDWRTMPR